jgi:type I restriction enzyme M protein
MVFLRRKSQAERIVTKDYPVFMAVTDRIGHDKRGHPIFKRGPEGGDILETRKTKVKVVEEGQIIEKVIDEKGPVIDDQLPDIPSLYRKWAKEHGL